MTQIKRASLLSLATILALPGAALAGADPVPSTLGDCIALALKKNPDAVSADLEIEASYAAQKAARGNFGPKVHVDASIQRWDKALPFNVGALGAMLPPGTTFPNVRDATTWSAGLTVAQPIGALWTIEEGYTLRKLGVDVARIGLLKARRDLAYQVTEAYYRLIQAMEMEEIAAKSVEQVGAQVQKAEAFFKNGMVGRNDFLRAQLGLAAANQRLIQTRGGVTLARGRLATLLGLPPDTAITPAQRVTEAPAAPAFSPQQAEESALGERIEFREVATRIEQASHGVDLAKSKMLPSLNALFNYTHSEGSAFQPKNAWFFGASLGWDVWEWGATYFGIDEAKVRVKQALAARSKAEDMIRLEVRSAYINVTTAAQALEVARQAVTQAEENYRIEQKRYEAANNTSFDVLDAETQLTNARAQMEAALYEYVIAESNLQRAVGRLPEQAKVKS